MGENRGRGPIGTDINRPAIDPQTSSRSRNLAPGDRTHSAAAKTRSDYFDVERLLPVLAANGWTQGESFMRFWIQGGAHTAKGDPKKDNKATIGINVDDADMRVYTIPWTWLVGGDGGAGFPEATDALRNFVDQKLFNDKAKAEIVRTHGHRAGRFGQFLIDGLSPERFRARIRVDQIQSMSVSVPRDVGKLNDLVAALADFAYYAMYRGETIGSDQFEARIADLKKLAPSLGLGPGMEDEDLLALLKRLYRGLILVDAVGVYAGDIYEFGGWQYLGNWDLKANRVSGRWDFAVDSWFFDDLRYGGDTYNIENATFRKYRDKTGRGGDFLALTPIRLIPSRRLIPIP